MIPYLFFAVGLIFLVLGGDWLVKAVRQDFAEAQFRFGVLFLSAPPD